jgi:hypothetical protein
MEWRSVKKAKKGKVEAGSSDSNETVEEKA